MRSAPCIREGSVYLLTEAATDLLTAKESGGRLRKDCLGVFYRVLQTRLGQTPFNSLPCLRQEKFIS